MNKHQLLNIKKMIFELGRGGSKNHFFDRVNDAREVKRFFAIAQNDDCENAGKRGRVARKFSRPLLGYNAGRSMLEMLGVLAIIGVLSVGAIMGFRQAMNRHKANVILNDVSLAFEELATHETTGAVSRYQVTAFTPESGHTLYAKRDATGNDSVEVAGVVQGVCEVLIQYDKTELYAQISDTAGAKLTACADNQTMVFGLGAGSSGSTDPDPGPGPEPTDPCEGKTCSGHGTCSDGVCTCSDGYTDPDCGTAPECNSAIACASPKVCSSDYHCECPTIGTPGVCQTTQTQNGCPAIVNVTGKCGTNGICTNGACSECSSPMIANSDGTACECPAKGANCKTQNGTTCECDLCEDGFEKNAAGECVEVSACAADTPVVCGTSCCPEGSTCDGDKCCLGGVCCIEGLKPTLCHTIPPNYRDRYGDETAYACVGTFKTIASACTEVREKSMKTFGFIDSNLELVYGYTVKNNSYMEMKLSPDPNSEGCTTSAGGSPFVGCSGTTLNNCSGSTTCYDN